MNEQKTIPAPIGLCGKCQTEAVNRGQHYCEHNQSGAVYITLDGVSSWLIYSPMPRDAFHVIVKTLPLSTISVTLTEPGKPARRVETHD